MEEQSVEKIAKELIKAAQASRYIGYAMFGVVGLYLAAVLATIVGQWLIQYWDKAISMFTWSLVVFAYLVWRES